MNMKKTQMTIAEKFVKEWTELQRAIKAGKEDEPRGRELALKIEIRDAAVKTIELDQGVTLDIFADGSGISGFIDDGTCYDGMTVHTKEETAHVDVIRHTLKLQARLFSAVHAAIVSAMNAGLKHKDIAKALKAVTGETR
jgi:hypothetical protein